jgi:hypothetical protein
LALENLRNLAKEENKIALGALKALVEEKNPEALKVLREVLEEISKGKLSQPINDKGPNPSSQQSTSSSVSFSSEKEDSASLASLRLSGSRHSWIAELNEGKKSVSTETNVDSENHTISHLS